MKQENNFKEMNLLSFISCMLSLCHDDVTTNDKIGAMRCNRNERVDQLITLARVQRTTSQFRPPLDHADSSFNHLTWGRPIIAKVPVILDAVLR